MKPSLPIACLVGMLCFVAACGAPETPPSAAQPDESPAAPEPASRSEAAAPAPAAPRPRPLESREVAVTLPAGSVLSVEFVEPLSSETAVVGDTVVARVVEAVSADGRVVVPRGASVTGQVAEVVSARKLGGRAHIDVHFTSLQVASGGDVEISATLREQARSETRKDAATIGGAAAGGALLGRVLGHEKGEEAKGTAAGAVVGAAIGTAIAATNEGQEVVIEPGHSAPIELDSAVTVRVPA